MGTAVVPGLTLAGGASATTAGTGLSPSLPGRPGSSRGASIRPTPASTRISEGWVTLSLMPNASTDDACVLVLL